MQRILRPSSYRNDRSQLVGQRGHVAGRREPPALVQGLLNLVFFLYLIRAEVRAKLR